MINDDISFINYMVLVYKNSIVFIPFISLWKFPVQPVLNEEAAEGSILVRNVYDMADADKCNIVYAEICHASY